MVIQVFNDDNWMDFEIQETPGTVDIMMLQSDLECNSAAVDHFGSMQPMSETTGSKTGRSRSKQASYHTTDVRGPSTTGKGSSSEDWALVVGHYRMDVDDTTTDDART